MYLLRGCAAGWIFLVRCGCILIVWGLLVWGVGYECDLAHKMNAGLRLILGVIGADGCSPALLNQQNIYMPAVKFVIVKGPDFVYRDAGTVELDIVPRRGEFVFYDQGDDNDPGYKVIDVIHRVEPRGVTEVLIVALGDEICR
jgi:hypothetical protein